MPALSLAESQSAVLIQTVVAITPGVTGLLQGEDYLLVHSCTASATRQTLRKINNEGKIYARYDYDFQMFFDIEAEMLSPYGLANWHPGANLTGGEVGSMPALACANARDLFRATGGINIYENPKVTFLPGDLPGVSFRVTRENASVLNDPAPPPAVDTVTTGGGGSGGGGGDDETYEYLTAYGVSTVWIRELDIVGPVTGMQYLEPGTQIWFTLPDTTPAPQTLAEFDLLVEKGISVPLINEITEVFITPVHGGKYLLPDNAVSGVILNLLNSGEPIPEPMLNNFLYALATDEDTYTLAGGYSSTATTAAEFIASQQSGMDTGNEIGGIEVVEVYSIHQAAWLTL